VDLHVPAVPDNFERLRSDYMVELHLKVMQHQLEQVRSSCVSSCLGNATTPCLRPAMSALLVSAVRKCS
jgi:hypothetical protein